MIWTDKAKNQFDEWSATSLELFKGWAEDELDAWWKEWSMEASKQDKFHFPTFEVWERMPRETKEILCANAAALRDIFNYYKGNKTTQ
jgi:hypothetical protein